MNKLWQPCINKKFNSDILINIFSYCDPKIINVCKHWRSIVLNHEHLWELWYKLKWSTKIYQDNWKVTYLKMNKLDYNWFNSIYHQTVFMKIHGFYILK